MPGTPTRFPNGITNVKRNAPLATYELPDPSKWHEYFNDFDTQTLTDWTVTKVGTGTNVLTNGDGGLLLLTNTAGVSDSIFYQKVGESFTLTPNKKLVFKTRVSLSEANLSSMIAGLAVTNATPLTAPDGIWFSKASGSTLLAVTVRKDTGAGANNFTTTFNMANNTFVDLTFVYEKGFVTFFANNTRIARLDASAAFLPDTSLTPTFGVQNGSAVARSMTIDHLLASKER